MSVNLRALAQLLLLSVFAGALWRAEVELHGWEGLIWLSYAHRALPVGAAAFIAWIGWSEGAPWGARRWLLMGLAAGYAALSFWLLGGALSMAARVGSEWGLLLAAPSPVGDAHRLALAAILLIPAGAFLLARLLGANLRWSMLPISVGFAALAGPAAIATLTFLDPEHADDLHAVKTGAAVPFAVFALGVPWIVRPRSAPLRYEPSP